MGELLSYLALHGAITFFSSIACFVLPGIFVVRLLRLKTSPFTQFLVACIVGIALFGMQSYINGWLGMRFVSYIYVAMMLGVSIAWIRVVRSFFRDLFGDLRKTSTVILGIIILGVFLQSMQMFGNGLPQKDGTRFWRTNAYDGIYHIGLIESMKRTFPPVEPSSSGQPVINYHYWSDLIISEQSRLFQTPSTFLFFQWWPIVISILTSLAVVEFVRVLTATQSKMFTQTATLLALLLLLLGSDAGWTLYWGIHHVVSFAYPAIDNGPTQFLNMPHTFGKLFFYVIGLLFLTWRKERRWSVLAALLFLSAVSVGMKVYFGLALAVGWMGIFLYDLLQVLASEKKKPSKIGTTILLFGAMGIGYTILLGSIYLPVNSGAGGLSWYPLEWPKLLINPNNIDWKELANRIEIAQYQNLGIKAFLYNLVLLAVGFLAIHGVRVFGFFLTKKTFKLFGLDGSIFFLLPVGVCTFLGFTTLQVSGGFNVFNFFVVSLAILVITLALFGAQVYERNRRIGIVLIAIVLLLSIPRSLFETSTMLSHYINGNDSVLVTSKEIEAYDYIRSLPKSSVVAISFAHPLESKSTYLGAFSGRQSYFSGKYLLETHNEPFEEKEKNSIFLFMRTELVDIREAALTFGITHVAIDAMYLRTAAELELFANRDRASFGNERVFVYDVRNL